MNVGASFRGRMILMSIKDHATEESPYLLQQASGFFASLQFALNDGKWGLNRHSECFGGTEKPKESVRVVSCHHPTDSFGHSLCTMASEFPQNDVLKKYLFHSTHLTIFQPDFDAMGMGG